MVALTATVVLGAISADAKTDEACADVRVEMQLDLGDEWSAAVRQLHDELARLGRSDCERVTLSVRRERGVVRLVAIGADGRRAERALEQPSSLVPTALGLILSIPAESPGAPLRSPTAEPLSSPLASDRTNEASQSANGARAFSAWLGVGMGARVGQPTSVLMADVEGRADLVLNHWLLLASFRYAPVGVIRGLRLDIDTYHEIAVSLGVGRSLDVGRVSFDFAVTPTLVAAKMEGDAMPGTDLDTDDIRQSDVQLRIGGSVRCLLPMAKTWRLTLSSDVEIAPADVGAPFHVDPRLPPFPSWTAGLRVGATGELL
jgi:hypothetical protein